MDQRLHHEQTELADFYFKRFRQEFRPAVNAWVATRPLKNPNAPPTPFAMPQYRLEARAEADRLEAEAEAFAAQVRRNIQRASNYVLGVVLFASALFFAGMSTKLTSPRAPRRDARAWAAPSSSSPQSGSRPHRSASPSEHDLDSAGPSRSLPARPQRAQGSSRSSAASTS